MFLQKVGKFLPILQKDGADVAMPYLVMSLAEEMKKTNPKDKKRNAEVAMKLFPQSKPFLKEWKKNLDEIV